MGNSKTVSQKSKNWAAIWSSNPTSEHISGKYEDSNMKRHMTLNGHHSTLYNSQDMEQCKCPPTDEWIKKMWYIYLYANIYYSAIKKNEIMPFAATWLDLIIILSEVNQAKANITYMWSLKSNTNELIYKTERDSSTLKINLWLSKGKEEKG